MALSAVIDKTNDALDRRLLEADVMPDGTSAAAAGNRETHAGQRSTSLADGSGEVEGKHKTLQDKVTNRHGRS